MTPDPFLEKGLGLGTRLFGIIQRREVRQHHVVLERSTLQTAIVKSSICLSTVKPGYCFDILRNESASTDKSGEHHGPWLDPQLVSVLVLCLLRTLHFKNTPGTGACACHKEKLKMPLDYKKLYLSAVITFHSNYIPQ